MDVSSFGNQSLVASTFAETNSGLMPSNLHQRDEIYNYQSSNGYMKEEVSQGLIGIESADLQSSTHLLHQVQSQPCSIFPNSMVVSFFLFLF